MRFWVEHNTGGSLKFVIGFVIAVLSLGPTTLAAQGAGSRDTTFKDSIVSEYQAGYWDGRLAGHGAKMTSPCFASCTGVALPSPCVASCTGAALLGCLGSIGASYAAAEVFGGTGGDLTVPIVGLVAGGIAGGALSTLVAGHPDRKAVAARTADYNRGFGDGYRAAFQRRRNSRIVACAVIGTSLIPACLLVLIAFGGGSPGF